MVQRVALAAFTLVAATILLVAYALSNGSVPVPGSNSDPGRAEERIEEADEAAQRLAALDAAVAEGRFGEREAITSNPAPGWAGEQVVSGVRDDWEPAVAADPKDPYVYILTTRFGYPKPCSGNCPIPHISLTVSADDGKTWGARTRSARARGPGSTTRSSRLPRTRATCMPST